MIKQNLALVGDIGGTNSRFALVENGCVQQDTLRSYANSGYKDIAGVIRAFFADTGNPKILRACLALACAIAGDKVTLTNYPWSFSQKALCEELGFKQLMLVNDFTALAMGVPSLAKNQYYAIGTGTAEAHQPIGVMGPGTGFGVSGLVWDGRHWVALQGEGGHISFAPVTDIEMEILRVGWKKYGRVSVERILSGEGLEFLYYALCQIKKHAYTPLAASAIVKEASLHPQSLCHEVVNIFCGVLGSVAGDWALSLGARGGVYIGGGIKPRLGDMVHQSPFRERFEDKGRHKNYMSSIPTYVITESEKIALVGAATILNDQI